MFLGSTTYLGGGTYLGEEDPPGAWGQLLSIIRGPVEQPPQDDCPNDGMPYRTGPDGQRYCPFDGYRPGQES